MQLLRLKHDPQRTAGRSARTSSHWTCGLDMTFAWHGPVLPRRPGCTDVAEAPSSRHQASEKRQFFARARASSEAVQNIRLLEGSSLSLPDTYMCICIYIHNYTEYVTRTGCECCDQPWKLFDDRCAGSIHKWKLETGSAVVCGLPKSSDEAGA